MTQPSGLASSAQGGLNEFETQALRNYPFLMVTVTILAVVAPDSSMAGDIADWDWFWLSGVIVFLVAYPLSLRVPGAVDDCLRQLAENGHLRRPERVPAFQSQLHRTANRYAYRTALVLGALVFCAWAVVIASWRTQSSGWVFKGNISGMVIETLCAGLAGRYVGRTLHYSTVGVQMRHAGLPVALDGEPAAPPDLVRALGAYWTALVDLLILLTAYLGTWLLLITYSQAAAARYAEWRGPYLLFVSGFLSTVVFVGGRALWVFRPEGEQRAGRRHLWRALLTQPAVSTRILIIAGLAVGLVTAFVSA